MEGALDWALPQRGGGRMRAPGGPQISSVTWREEAFYQPPFSPLPPQGVCVGIPAWTGGRHFLGMANFVPQPNQGAAAGYSGQKLQESKHAPGVQSVFHSDPGQHFPLASEKQGCLLKMGREFLFFSVIPEINCPCLSPSNIKWGEKP